MDAAGVAHYAGMQGRSFWPLLGGGADPAHHRDDVYCEYYNAMHWHNPQPHMTMVRTTRHKLAVAHGLGEGELYDLAEDPGETHNLWADPACLPLKAEMLARLCDRMAWTVDPLPERRAAY